MAYDNNTTKKRKFKYLSEAERGNDRKAFRVEV